MAAENSFLSHIFNRHMLIHGAFMVLGMVVPAVAMAASAAGASATFGDIALGTVDMGVSMVKGTFEGLPALGDAFMNAAGGDWAAQSYQMGMMDHGAMHAAADVANHSAAMAHETAASSAAGLWGVPAADHNALMNAHP
jgi:hypothetical protein